MSQLRSMLLSNVGYKSAYYSGNLLNFCNPETDDPENTVIWLSNQGGKTTLISLLFTNIEPNTGQFIQHLQKTDHHFADYFYSTPGIIALELQTQGSDLAGKKESLVIGQCVVIKQGGTPHRIYFLFKTNDALGISDLPCKGAGLDKNLVDIVEFRKWADKAYEKNSTFILVENNQGEWKKHLETAGVEHELLAKQIDFCRSEGGISEFASFKNEGVFLEQLFKLALNEETAKRAKDTLSDAHKKYKEIPLLEKEYEIKEKLLDGFEKILPFAQAYKTYETETDEHNIVLSSLAQKLHLRSSWLEEENRIFTKKIKEAETQINQKKEGLVKRELIIQQAKFSLLICKQFKAEEIAKEVLDDN